MKKILLGFGILLLLSGCSTTTSDKNTLPDVSNMNMQNMDHSASPNLSPSSQAFQDANTKMHKNMNIPFTGDADTDFVTGMIPHHQGAIDMARIVLQYGKNEEIKQLAQNVIKAQQQEIAFMKEWLKNHQQ